MEDEVLDTQESVTPEGEANTETVADESIDALSDAETKLKKAEEIAHNQKIRAEKAEQELKALKKTPKEEEAKEGLSVKDVIALRDVHEDDVDFLLEEAKLRGKTVPEVKKDPNIKIVLKAREEERRTAEATNTGGARRGTNKLSDEALIEAWNNGTIKEEDIPKVAQAQLNQKIAKAKRD